MSTPDEWYRRTRDLTLQLVSWPSVTDSEDESRFAHRLYDLLAAQPYFRTHPDQLWLERTAGDRRERYNLFALVRGQGPQTVVLAGHYDSVSIENYGALAPLAYDPQALLPALIDDLRANASSEADRLALRDLQSGEFLPGRAVLDMKSGLAAGLAVLQRFAESAGRAGNLLLIATPDEEGGSHGMRSAAQRLPQIAVQQELVLQAAINLDSVSDQGDGADGRAIFLGSVGKLLPAALLVGRPTHAGNPFDGISANLLAAELVRQVECNPELSDVGNGAVTPPPINLRLADLKDWYDVTTPEHAWCTFNVLTLTASPQAVLSRARRLVAAALNDASALLRQRAAAFVARGGSVHSRDWTPSVLVFSELKERAFQMLGAAAEQRWAELLAALAAQPNLNMPGFSQRVVEELVRWAKLDGPAAVICFASLYYPPVQLAGDQAGSGQPAAPARARHQRLLQVVAEQAGALAAELGQSIQLRPYFEGISDMSFLGAQVPEADAGCIAANTPGWGTRLQVDFSAISTLQLPVVNIGPWGRDYHQRLERVHAPYAFATLPELVWRVASQVLQAGQA